MDGWDVALLVAAGYVAVMALVRLMRHRRDQMLNDLRRQVGRQPRKDARQRDSQRKQTA